MLGVVAVSAPSSSWKVAPVGVAGQAPAATGSATKTAWGDPDLQGIWTDEFQTPLQRQAKYAGKELFTEQERAELDNQRAGILRRDQRVEIGTERDVAGAYNAVFQQSRIRRANIAGRDRQMDELSRAPRRNSEARRTVRSGSRSPSPRKLARIKSGGAAEYGRRHETSRDPRSTTRETQPLRRPRTAHDERCMAAVLPIWG